MLNKNFTRDELVKKLYKNLGFSKNFCSKILDDFFELMITELIKDKKIKITSFGTFEVLQKKERIGRNPKTKIDAKITSRKVIKFKPSVYAKRKVNIR